MLIPVVQEFRNSLADWFWHRFLMKFLSRWSQELHLSEGLTVAGGSAPKTVLPHGAGCWHGTSVAPHVDLSICLGTFTTWCLDSPTERDPREHGESHNVFSEVTPKTSLVVQWLRRHTPNAAGPRSIPSQGARSYTPQIKILLATTKTRHSQMSK